MLLCNHNNYLGRTTPAAAGPRSQGRRWPRAVSGKCDDDNISILFSPYPSPLFRFLSSSSFAGGRRRRHPSEEAFRNSTRADYKNSGPWSKKNLVRQSVPEYGKTVFWSLVQIVRLVCWSAGPHHITDHHGDLLP